MSDDWKRDYAKEIGDTCGLRLLRHNRSVGYCTFPDPIIEEWGSRYLFLARNSYEYWENIRVLRNKARDGFIEQKTISEREHEDFMKEYSDCYYLCFTTDVNVSDVKFVGFCGVIDDDIRVATDPEFAGKGVGQFMIKNLMKLHPTAFAKVKVDNEASLKLFEKCGFKKKYIILESS